ncbi:MAG: hypothetical protein KA154_01850 [Gemmatimonadaceae bacterium]|jgi:hypothetical protein|nr:hypothetical protein [Gemmatimonadaceae bacterium]MCC6430508.1 hypothetical protein [Gemmatimonadaceae bacterium]
MKSSESTPPARARQFVAVVAILFGLASVGAGGSVLAGRDPGYLVYRPLVVFNTLMGVLYIGAGVLAWRRAHTDRMAAAGIAGVNLLVLAYIVFLYRSGGAAAIDSVRAMGLRTGVWLLVLLVLVWAGRGPSDTA